MDLPEHWIQTNQNELRLRLSVCLGIRLHWFSRWALWIKETDWNALFLESVSVLHANHVFLQRITNSRGYFFFVFVFSALGLVFHRLIAYADLVFSSKTKWEKLWYRGWKIGTYGLRFLTYWKAIYQSFKALWARKSQLSPRIFPEYLRRGIYFLRSNWRSISVLPSFPFTFSF